MSTWLNGRTGHYLLLLVAWTALCPINLGGPSLWDIDEGNNAECAREMYESGNPIVPTFNFKLRTDKPALLYWLQMTSYHFFGINEFSARLPSALAALVVVLLTYEMGRRMFGAGAALLAGLILISTVLFCGAAHFANPDALLCACTLGTLCLFWSDYERGGDRWLVLTGLTAGLGMLAKGPVGLVLPTAVIGLFLLWQRQLHRMFRPALLWGTLVFTLVAVPWYAWVGAETRGQFLNGFFLQHNVNRFLEPMENHRGPVIYYLLILLVGFAPWSSFFALTGWHVWTHKREQGAIDARYRFLFCWIVVYLLFFSVSRTKLPNYVLPIYPALALLVGHCLDRWRRAEAAPPRWLLHLSLASLVFTGVVTIAATLLGGGAVGGDLMRGRHLPGLEFWAVVGIVPIVGAAACWFWLRREQRNHVLGAAGVTAVLWLGLFAAWGTEPIDRHKAPRPLADALAELDHRGDVYIASFGWFQPSVVFYCRRQVEEIKTEAEVLEWLRYPAPAYVFLPADQWKRLQPKVTGPHREIARERCLYRGCDVVLVANR